jgi:hypothetical protein
MTSFCVTHTSRGGVTRVTVVMSETLKTACFLEEPRDRLRLNFAEKRVII